MKPPIYLPIVCGTKKPATSGWASADFVTPDNVDADYRALRTDDLVVVDCDTPEAAAQWVKHEPSAALTPQVRTARGRHFYYARPENPPDELHSDSRVADGVDIKTGSGAYVMAAGALHPDGSRYEWIDDSAGRELQPMPPIVATLLRRRQSSTSSSSTDADAETWDEIPEGRRNVTLAAIAGTLRKQGMAPVGMMRTLSGINKAYCSPPLGTEELVLITKSVSRYDVDPNLESVTVVVQGIQLLHASEMGPPPPKTWLWEPYVPDCTMTLVSGREGIGKGLFCTYLAACMATGSYPDGSTHEPKKVLWLSAEDHPHLDIWARLRAAGWNPDEHAEIDFTDPRSLIVLPDDMTRLRDLLETGEYGLVIMDPGRSYIGTRERAVAFSYNNESDLRPALQQLVFLSADLTIPLLFVGHWKKGDGPTRDATSGSLAWKQVVRHALDFAEVRDEHAFWVGKSNGGHKGYVRSYDLEAIDEWKTARFVAGGPLQFASLDQWIQSHGRPGRGDTLVEILDDDENP